MLLFILGALGIIGVCIAGLFLPCYYSQGWGYAAYGKSKAYSTAQAEFYTLIDEYLNHWSLYFLLAIIILGLTIYVVLMFCNKSNLVSNVVIFFLAIAPFIIILYNIKKLKSEGKYIGIGNSLVIGAGRNSGLTGIGRLLLILSIVFFILLVIGFNLNHKKQLENSKNKPPKEIKVKRTNDTAVYKDDFKL